MLGLWNLQENFMGKLYSVCRVHRISNLHWNVAVCFESFTNHTPPHNLIAQRKGGVSDRSNANIYNIKKISMCKKRVMFLFQNKFVTKIFYNFYPS